MAIDAKAARDTLAKLYPDIFKTRRPMKTDIRADFIRSLTGRFGPKFAEVISEETIDAALAYQTSSVKYLQRLREGTPRYDIHGQLTAERVTAEQAKHARARFNGIWKQRRRKRPTAPKPPARPVVVQHPPASKLTTPRVRGDRVEHSPQGQIVQGAGR